MDFTTLLWMSVVVVFGIIGAHWAGLDPLVRLGLKNRRYVTLDAEYLLKK